MRIESEGRILVLHAGEVGGNRRVEIVSDFADALGRWTPNTRISPIWPVENYRLGLSDAFAEGQSLLFLGPIQPGRLTDDHIELRTAGAVELWLTPGCFNVVVRAADVDGAVNGVIVKLRDWAKAQSIPQELWRIQAGVISETTWSTHSADAAADELRRLAKLAKIPLDEALEPAMQEYLAVQASSLTRAAAMAPHLYEDFRLFGQTVEKMVQAYKADQLTALELNSSLLSFNAALSRASSQTFSGTPPIDGTECHFWVHSLLGTGAANIALARLVAWIDGILGAERIPERLRALKDDRKDPPDLRTMQSDVALLAEDVLDRVKIDPTAEGPVIPLVTYFSGRDGFSSHLQTLSAPVATLAECNSHRSSLLTVTHEISHVLIRGVLGAIYPDHNDPEAMKALKRSLRGDYAPATWHDSATKLLLEGLIGMELAGDGRREIPDIEDKLLEIVLEGRAEAQEILVHTFDFMYFYASDPEFYIESIWRSWSAIPGIADRVPGYVMRTLCAISAKLLREKPELRLPAAIKTTKQSLAKLQAAGGLMSDYVKIAIDYLDHVAADSDRLQKLQEDWIGRLNLVWLIAIFLHADRVGAKLFDDPYVRKGPIASGGKTALIYDTSAVGNPLTFLAQTLKQNPTPAESLWVLHTLAFDLRATPGSSHAGA